MKSHVVPRDWVGEVVAIVASGPSVAEFKFRRIKELKTIAVKDGYHAVPSADVLLIGDHRYARRNPDLSQYLGPLILYTDPVPLPEKLFDSRIEFIPKVAGGGLSENPRELRGSFTTTALAINYAVLRGARKVLLIGVDGKAAPDGTKYFVGEHKEDWHMRYERQRWGYSRLPRDFRRLGVQVFNLNPKSAVKEFPFLPEGKERE